MFTYSRITGSILLGLLLLAVGASVRAATIQGIVKGPDGKPISGAEVRIEGMKSTHALSSVKTDQKGSYVFKNVAVGTYRLTTWVNKIPTQIGNVKARADGAVRVDFDIKGAAAQAIKKKTKHAVWVETEMGTHIGGGHWVEVNDDGTIPSDNGNVQKVNKDALRDIRQGTPTGN